ncbi:uncharacterized protein LOC117785920 [Drosophila innubila]|uniref:uncharacterized protein LOC117785920 n=1 Tax=Drosophila innubila TaxID=198719 RepID=UPI00148B4A5D|nr:uncharacterized protein LOC117785920 [Drosophila innubila]
MRTIFILLGFFHIWVTLKLTYNEAIVFKFTNAVCESYNESWFVYHKCRLKAVSRNKTTLNLNGTVLHPAYDIGLHAQIFKKANGYKPWVVKAELDICRFVKRAYNPVAKIVFNLFKEFSNFNHSCPYVGPQIVNGFYLRSNYLPHTIPTGDYLLSMTWLFDKRPQFSTKVYFIFTEDL